MTVQSTSLRLADALARNRYAWPGGYPAYAVTSDGGALCHNCCAAERQLIGTTTGSDGWCVVGIDINWEQEDLLCDNCNALIESAYWEEASLPGEESLTAAERNPSLLLR